MRPDLKNVAGRARRWSNAVLRRLGPSFDGEVVNVSAWDDRDKEGGHYRDYFPQATGYALTNYPGPKGLAGAEGITDYVLDLTQPLPPALVRRFDVAFSHTTLEHIFDVRTAFHALCELSRDIVIVVVPFAQQLHMVGRWGDFWRFTPMGLGRLFAENGLDVVFETGDRGPFRPIYLVSVGSRRAEHWRGRLPQWSPVQSLGGWIDGSIGTVARFIASRLTNRMPV